MAPDEKSMMQPEVYRSLGLSDKEYQGITKILKREPSKTELAMFQWSGLSIADTCIPANG